MMIWILVLAALVAHVSCENFETPFLTQTDYCDRRRILPYECKERFQAYLAAHQTVKKCLPDCLIYSNNCASFGKKCPSRYTSRFEEFYGRHMFGYDFDEPPMSRVPLNTKVTKFALRLFKEALPEGNDQNFVLSPMLVQSLLAYLADGASNETRQALDSVVQLNDRDLNELKQLIEPSAERASSVSNKLDAASQIFRSSRVKLLPSFVQSLKDKKLPQEEMDFSNREHAARTINDWVRQKTRGKIPEAVDAESLNPETQLMLLNALYFNGTWMYSFNRTEPDTFYETEAKQSSVRMMHLTRNLRSGYTRASGVWKPKEGFLWVELPYVGDTISMVLLLPKERFQLTRELKDFNEDDLDYIFTEIFTNNQDEVKLRVPEFKVNSAVSLVDPLKKMGLASAFEGENPFDKISKESVKISEVKQKSFLSVDQTGTVAASFTFATIIPLSLPRSTEFYVDQPFGVIIIDKANRLPLFLGRISRPEKIKKRGSKFV